MAEDVPNPSYLRGTEREVYQFFNDFLPTGQAVNITQAGGTGAVSRTARCLLRKLHYRIYRSRNVCIQEERYKIDSLHVTVKAADCL